MSREDSVYEAKSKILPYKWCAPEVIFEHKSSMKSDVWSYGVVMWEIFSMGRMPYGSWTNEEVIKKVCEEGYRLPKPEKMPQEVYALAEQCWQFEAENRPSFKEIYESLLESNQQILQDYQEREDESRYNTGTDFVVNTGGTETLDPANHRGSIYTFSPGNTGGTLTSI
eukprot:TRINITY_DN8080_c1_g1_i1.p1 TRINITY_DN8080_c1_g1~~TRINITY_DN8080_c1_g1_i1.p1  ORF type:complete len:169 (-),score=75.27 TRINITY_DN8080_c1_g1_i1:33-539(-)